MALFQGVRPKDPLSRSLSLPFSPLSPSFYLLSLSLFPLSPSLYLLSLALSLSSPLPSLHGKFAGCSICHRQQSQGERERERRREREGLREREKGRDLKKRFQDLFFGLCQDKCSSGFTKLSLYRDYDFFQTMALFGLQEGVDFSHNCIFSHNALIASSANAIHPEISV